MLLVAYERKWTFSLCSLYLIWNMVAVKSLNTNKKKELFFVSDDKVFQKNYRLEDFFWTGSGDGPLTEELFSNFTESDLSLVQPSPLDTWRTTTVFHTTTILFATIYSNSEGCIEHGCEPHVYTVQTESTDLSLPTILPFTTPDILPTATQDVTKTITTYIPSVYFPSNGVKGDITPPESVFVSSTYFPDGVVNQTEFSKTNWNTANVTNTTVFPDVSSDQKYWVVTVLRSDEYSPKFEINLTENKLSSLYKKAFNRRQEKFLRGTDLIKGRTSKQPVKVHIFNVTRQGNDVEILYIVTVSGAPIPAMTAANDMRLLTASEVIAELGYPILTKAEPYIKNVVPLGARIKGRTRDTWLFVGSIIAAVLLLLILVGLFALGLSKNRTKRNTEKGPRNKKQVFEEEGGNSNLAFEVENDLKSKSEGDGSYRNQFKFKNSKTFGETSGTTVKFTEEERKGSPTSSSCSGSSEASLVRLRYQQKRREKRKEEREEKPKPKPRTRVRRIESSDCSKNFRKHEGGQSASSAISKNTFDEITPEGYDELDFSPRLMKSPTSYLSMPSVRAFPRGTKIPEPLNKILEPTSIRHLDADSDSQNERRKTKERKVEVDIEQVCEVKNKFIRRKALTRHASLEGEDPGYIGPVVWNRHCQRINERETALTLHEEEFDETVNVGRMRKRFNELLDDALSMFGSRTVSPEGSDDVPIRHPDNRVHSAVVRPAGSTTEEIAICRPKTTGSKRPQSSVVLGPKGAWETPSSSTLTRPVSAGVFRKSSPTVNRSLIYVNSDLPPSDPAIPLIAAIKNELKKFDDPSHINT